MLHAASYAERRMQLVTVRLRFDTDDEFCRTLFYSGALQIIRLDSNALARPLGAQSRSSLALGRDVNVPNVIGLRREPDHAVRPFRHAEGLRVLRLEIEERNFTCRRDTPDLVRLESGEPDVAIGSRGDTDGARFRWQWKLLDLAACRNSTDVIRAVHGKPKMTIRPDRDVTRARLRIAEREFGDLSRLDVESSDLPGPAFREPQVLIRTCHHTIGFGILRRDWELRKFTGQRNAADFVRRHFRKPDLVIRADRNAARP